MPVPTASENGSEACGAGRARCGSETPVMILLNAHKVSYSLPGRDLLLDADLTLNEGEKVGLIGRNGSGKSTFLKLLASRLQPDSGTITLRNQVELRYLEQLPQLSSESGLSLIQAVLQGVPRLLDLRSRYEEACRHLPSATGSQQADLEKEINSLTDELTLHDAWDLETRAQTLLTTLGFSDLERPLAQLSGGEIKRLSLAATLLVPPDILLLDEPTNHLDIATISWLERYLKGARFTVLMVTHDRYFLERVCQRIVEVADLGLQNFAGNYSQYLDLKAEREATKARQQERFDNVMRQEKAWLLQGPKARSTKQKARLERIQQMLDDGSGILTEPGQTEDAAWDLGTRRLGKKVVTVTIDSHRILKPLEFELRPGERVGIVGANGSGKTTFLDLIAGRQKPEKGEVSLGETVAVGYFDQHTARLSHLPEDTRALEAVKEIAPFIPLKNGKELTAARLAEMFLFSGPMQSIPIGKLSGGERKRLELLRILMARPNLFVADEPTNDLDLETLSRLEFFLDNFPGCVCLASHDRFLLQRICDRILIFRNGRVEECLPQVLEEMTAESFAEEPTRAAPAKTPSSPPPVEAQTPAKRKLSYKEQRELAELEQSIPRWEQELEQLDSEIAAKADSYTAIRELLEKKEKLSARLEAGVEKWAALEELRESLQA